MGFTPINAREQLIELFEVVSGCSISDYDESQLPFLADYIQGELEANEECIYMLKAKVKSLELKLGNKASTLSSGLKINKVKG